MRAAGAGDVDDLVIGSGMAGLAVAALLARGGRRVLVLEAHDAPGGYAHTFTAGRYRFCAQVHYVFGCGPGETIDTFLGNLGLRDTVRFNRLDPDGYDHIVVGADRYRVPSGWLTWRDRLLTAFPEAAQPLRAYFRTVAELVDELHALPDDPGVAELAAAPFRFPTLLRLRHWTLERFYDELAMPTRLRAVLAGQCGDYLLPPARVSLLLHANLVTAYGRGAYYPQKHYAHLVGSVVDAIRACPGCDVLLDHQVTSIHVQHGRATHVTTANGRTFRARRVISNADPAHTVALAGRKHFSSRFLQRMAYEYSYGTVTLYLGLRGLDPRDHGFGSFNVWSYPHDDLNRIYADQGERNDLSQPWLFLATPTLHTGEPGLAPPGHHVLIAATHARHDAWRRLRDTDRSAYNRQKKALREHLLEVIETRHLPHLREHVDVALLGTPATNERFVRAPFGNAYGAALTPAQVGTQRAPWRGEVDNLWFVNATAGWPSIGGTIHTAMGLARRLLQESG